MRLEFKWFGKNGMKARRPIDVPCCLYNRGLLLKNAICLCDSTTFHPGVKEAVDGAGSLLPSHQMAYWLRCRQVPPIIKIFSLVLFLCLALLSPAHHLSILRTALFWLGFTCALPAPTFISSGDSRESHPVLCVCFSVYWDYAMTILLQEIVYLHCHQQGGSAAFD